MRSREYLLAVTHAMPVFLGYPFTTFLFVSALRSLPQAFEYLIIDFAEHLSGNHIPLVVDPPADDRVELKKRFYSCHNFYSLVNFAKQFAVYY